MKNVPLQERMERRRTAWAAVLLFLFMLVLAFVPAWKAVAGLARGATIDLHRDEAFVRALLEGHYGEDPTYLGGGLWYTPLITWLEAAATYLTGMPAAQAIVQLGPFANLLAPVTFFIMCWYFLGPVRAVAATAAYLFWAIGQEPGWVVATYSHRLIPVSFSQSFFFLELILIDKAFRKDRPWPSLAAGLGAGLTFLAHAGPAILAVLLIALITCVKLVVAYRRKNLPMARGATIACLFAAGGFLAASLPLTWYLFKGSMQVANREGFLFTYYALTLQHLGLLLYHNLTWYMLLAAAGFILVVRRSALSGASAHTRTLLLCWLMVAVALFVYSYAISVADSHLGISLPALLPTFHFYFYASAVLSVFAGQAFVVALLRAWAWLHARHWARRSLARTDLAMGCFLVIALCCTLNYPAYATRRDVAVVRSRDLAFQADRLGAEAADRIHALVPWTGVVLCRKDLSIWPLLCTARHVVATASTMGNPYLDQRKREADNELLLQGMEQARTDTGPLLRAYKVSHLLVRPSELARMPEAPRWFPHEVFRNDSYILLAR
ncbi:MAG: hypothetical protein KBH07_05150 [Flavobacteriales bacterium]|nr:hypothetical protein [Flavobacteriales bacterium]